MRTDENHGKAGNAGSIEITNTGRLLVRNGGEISAKTSTTGKGGNIRVTGNNIEITNRGNISAGSTATGLSTPDKEGLSGNIFVTAADAVRLQNGGKITVATSEATAGNISIKAGNLLRLSNKSEISTSANNGKGDGGNITIEKPTTFVILEDGDPNKNKGSQIVAQAKEGKGGAITIDSDFFFAPQDTCRDNSCVDASSLGGGISGKVEITSPNANVVSGMLALSESFLDPTGLMSERCAARAVEKISSFVVTGREGMPRSPDSLLPAAAPMPAADHTGQSKQTGMTRSGHTPSTFGMDAEAIAFGCER
jgi:large exoprotein involved in heme utilization and adhesion